MFESKGFKKLTLFLGLLTFLSITLTLIDFKIKPQNGKVQGISDSVTVRADVGGCILDIKANMERRYNDNMSTILTIQVYQQDTDTHLGDITVTTDSDGEAIVNGCSEGVMTRGNRYDFYVRGFSHLTNEFPNKLLNNTNVANLDFTESQTFEFKAGETSNTYDNKINSLDLSTQIQHMYSDDYKNDLTQDGKVNSLDIANTIDNFYMKGDDLP